MKILPKKYKNEKGQSAVEFALVLPLLLLVLLGMAEFGWMFNAKISTNSAAREAARVRAVLGYTADSSKEAEFEAKAALAAKSALGSTIDPSKVTVTFTYDIDLSESKMYVLVNVDGMVTPLIGFFYSGDQSVEGEASMRIE
jgi:Flp pilus assembly protein TadG